MMGTLILLCFGGSLASYLLGIRHGRQAATAALLTARLRQIGDVA